MKKVILTLALLQAVFNFAQAAEVNPTFGKPYKYKCVVNALNLATGEINTLLEYSGPTAYGVRNININSENGHLVTLAKPFFNNDLSRGAPLDRTQIPGVPTGLIAVHSNVAAIANTNYVEAISLGLQNPETISWVTFGIDANGEIEPRDNGKTRQRYSSGRILKFTFTCTNFSSSRE